MELVAATVSREELCKICHQWNSLDTWGVMEDARAKVPDYVELCISNPVATKLNLLVMIYPCTDIVDQMTTRQTNVPENPVDTSLAEWQRKHNN